LFSPTGDFYTGGGVDYLLNFNGQVYVAEYKSKVLGVAYLYRSESENIANFGILVADPYQRRGIGTQLMLLLEEKSKEREYRALRTSGGTHPRGHLIGLLKRLGYRALWSLNSNIVMEKRLIGEM